MPFVYASSSPRSRCDVSPYVSAYDRQCPGITCNEAGVGDAGAGRVGVGAAYAACKTSRFQLVMEKRKDIG